MQPLVTRAYISNVETKFKPFAFSLLEITERSRLQCTWNGFHLQHERVTQMTADGLSARLTCVLAVQLCTDDARECVEWGVASWIFIADDVQRCLYGVLPTYRYLHVDNVPRSVVDLDWLTDARRVTMITVTGTLRRCSDKTPLSLHRPSSVVNPS